MIPIPDSQSQYITQTKTASKSTHKTPDIIRAGKGGWLRLTYYLGLYICTKWAGYELGKFEVLSSIHYLYSAFYNANCMLLTCQIKSNQKAAGFLSYFNDISKFQ